MPRPGFFAYDSAPTTPSRSREPSPASMLDTRAQNYSLRHVKRVLRQPDPDLLPRHRTIEPERVQVFQTTADHDVWADLRAAATRVRRALARFVELAADFLRSPR